MIRIAVVEDQAMVLGALAALLEMESDIEVVVQAADGGTAFDAIADHRLDVVVTDIEMPHVTGLELAERVRREHPSCKVIILTTFARAGYLRRALDAGASGYLLKDAPARDLADAVRRVHAGGRAIDPELAAEAWSEPDPLTDRERHVLRLAGRGMTSADIAKELGLTEGTVRNYLSEAIGKLGVGNRNHAVARAREMGLVLDKDVFDPDPPRSATPGG